jgi:hypothetical protein
MYDEDEAGLWGEGKAYDEIVPAIQNRGVTKVSIMGNSHGGGSVYTLAWRLQQNTIPGSGYTDITTAFSVPFTACVDAITKWTIGAENRRPPMSGFHTNQYQRNTYLINGGPSSPIGEDDVDRSYLGVVHTTIDDHVVVQSLIKLRLEQLVSP